ncbi:MAG TPA: TetR family transcriptional regulator [Candidatus Dormibacteraeota bacterium]
MPYEAHGRAGQKGRTRGALISAARSLIAQGVTPTVEAAAAAALISRTTAYRYFSSQRALLIAAHPEIETTSMLPPNPPRDPESRLDAVLHEFHRMILETELQQRTALRLSLEPGSQPGDHPLRQGRAVGWIAEALSPLQTLLPEEDLMGLVFAIRSATGIEALVWLTDVAGLSREEATALMRDSAQALLRSALSKAVAG